MKRIAVLLSAATLAVVCVATAGAQAWRRSGQYVHITPEARSGLTGAEFHNIGLSWQGIDIAGKSVLIHAPVTRGVAITTGHSFLVHERPLLRVLRLGFDVVWFDIEYGRWRRTLDANRDGDNDRKWLHKLDMGIGAGPAVHIDPGGRWGIHTWFRYSPTLSAVTHNFASGGDGKFELVAGYASYFSTGLAVAWSAFSFGAEYRFGGGTYRGVRIPDVTISPENIEQLLDLNIKQVLDKERHRMSGGRVFLSFRF